MLFNHIVNVLATILDTILKYVLNSLKSRKRERNLMTHSALIKKRQGRELIVYVLCNHVVNVLATILDTFLKCVLYSLKSRTREKVGWHTLLWQTRDNIVWWAASQENLSLGFLTRCDTNKDVTWKMARGMKFLIYEVVGLYWQHSESKCADQLCIYCTADLLLFSHYAKRRCGSYDKCHKNWTC